MSIIIQVLSGLTGGKPSGYPVRMWCWHTVLVGLSLWCVCPMPTVVQVAASEEAPQAVPSDEYLFYDLAVTEKFLSVRTRVVIIERLTSAYLDPDQPANPTLAWLQAQGFFGGRLPSDLIRDFVAKNQRPARLGAHFSFGVRYRFVTGDGTADAEAGLWAIPTAWPAQEVPNVDPEAVDRLVFSRVGLTLRGDQALLFVANHRPDNSGAGFLFWFVRRQRDWTLYDTEVMWVATLDRGPAGPP
ncbi:hypothetical protein FBQ96_03945 [Nitrospirales bacterium NOB]|nr:MAG: hypothetical protein UZ03_NOB001000437 [Nitrospira sp. OLB3]MBV6470713.1 hypothetical protein [Nitrospirota bacterium]MCE7964871.1 hypothetical protein [Nitrospira sp. NTP2]MCK6492313.1 hypothetical protein [Nitrospira sp.]MDL1888729.1 hypothetical protein [Nitrospirales bacterium NOB]MEB2338036.1 hypothetical protein [Nitrospirales bacterium]